MSAFRQLRVLIVEDEGMIAMDIETIVEDEGHEVVGWATTAIEAMSMFDDVEPDLVFVDVQLLDGTSGIDVARYMRERDWPKFVFLTANPSVIDSDLLGGIGVLSKPFTQAKLASTLRYLHNGLFDPPPSVVRPSGLTLGPAYASVWS